MRTVTREVEMHGKQIKAGDRVVIWNASANRDEAHFPDPDRFDIKRTPNEHVALGHGEHFCARRQSDPSGTESDARRDARPAAGPGIGGQRTAPVFEYCGRDQTHAGKIHSIPPERYMNNYPLVVRVLAAGAINGAALAIVAFLLSRFIRDIVGRSLVVIFLFVAAGAYFGFAVLAKDVLGTDPIWTSVELAQVLVFGTMGLLGLRGSPWWIAAGWALHPFWDLLHYMGPGHSFAPMTYAVSCFSYDLIVAAYIAVAYGMVGAGRLKFR
jgi:hypothetical protein